MPSRDETDPHEALPANLQGELNTLRNLVGEVAELLVDRQVQDADFLEAAQALGRRLEEETPTDASLKAVRDHLGQVVGRAAAEIFNGRSFVAWQRHRWEDVGPHDWPAVGDSVAPDLAVNVARDAWGSASLLLTNVRDGSLEIAVTVAQAAGSPRATLRRGWHVPCPDRRYRADALILVAAGRLIVAPGETTYERGCEPGTWCGSSAWRRWA